MEGDLTPSYRLHIYFGEEDVSIANTFKSNISKDKRFEGLGKGKNKVSAVVKKLMNTYNKQVESKGFPKGVIEEEVQEENNDS